MMMKLMMMMTVLSSFPDLQCIFYRSSVRLHMSCWYCISLEFGCDAFNFYRPKLLSLIV